MNIWVIQHSGYEDIGAFANALNRRNAIITFFSGQDDDIAALDPIEPDLLLVMGGAASAADLDGYPFLKTEIAFLKKRIQANKPILGLCLGGQLLSLALGGCVTRAHNGNEVGWTPLTLTTAAENTPMRHLCGQLTNMMHWHEDTLSLPEGCILLAATDHCAVQAFTHGDGILGFQCHPDISSYKIERWTHLAANMAYDAGTNPEEIKSDMKEFMPQLQKQTDLFFEDWLKGLNL